MAGSFIVLSDIHFNLWSYGDPKERLEEQFEAFARAMQYAVDQNVDAILVPGDIFHTQGSVQTQVLQGLYGVLESYVNLRRKIVFLPGNHDMVYRHAGDHALDFLRAFGYVASGDVEKIQDPIMLPNMPMIWTIPYSDDEEKIKHQLDFFENREGDLLLMHQGVRGVEFLSKGFVLDEGVSPDMIPDGVFHAFVGHCHSLRRVSKNMTVPGALMQHNFGDAGDTRGFLHVKFSDAGCTMEQIPVKSPQFISLDYEEDHRKLHDICSKYDEGGDYVRVVGVPISKIGEVRAWTQETARNEVKLVTCPDSTVPVVARPPEWADFNTLFERFALENALEPKILEVGREILGATRALS